MGYLSVYNLSLFVTYGRIAIRPYLYISPPIKCFMFLSHHIAKLVSGQYGLAKPEIGLVEVVMPINPIVDSALLDEISQVKDKGIVQYAAQIHLRVVLEGRDVVGSYNDMVYLSSLFCLSSCFDGFFEELNRCFVEGVEVCHL